VAELANHRGILTRTDLDHWTIDGSADPCPVVRQHRQHARNQRRGVRESGIALLPGFLATPRSRRVLPESRLDQLEATALQAEGGALGDTIRCRKSAPEAP
jgi:hypothetical protein